jgi:hypothetical protein
MADIHPGAAPLEHKLVQEVLARPLAHQCHPPTAAGRALGIEDPSALNALTDVLAKDVDGSGHPPLHRERPLEPSPYGGGTRRCSTGREQEHKRGPQRFLH